MSANTVFVQALADACDRPVEVSPELEATTLGAGFLAGLATGIWAGPDEVAALWAPEAVVEPSGRPSQRERWRPGGRAGRGVVPGAERDQLLTHPAGAPLGLPRRPVRRELFGPGQARLERGHEVHDGGGWARPRAA